MKTYLFLFTYFLFYSTLFGQTSSIAISNQQGHIEATILQESRLVKNVQNTYYAWYRGREINTTQGTYEGKLLHGNFVRMDKQQQLLEKGTYRLGVKNGTWYGYHHNGTLATIEQWRNGKKVRASKSFNQDGELQEIVYFKKGVPFEKKNEKIKEEALLKAKAAEAEETRPKKAENAKKSAKAPKKKAAKSDKSQKKKLFKPDKTTSPKKSATSKKERSKKSN